MLAWIRSPRGSTATATAVAAVLALFWLAPWHKPLPFTLPMGLSQPGEPSETPAVAAASAPATQQSASATPAPAAGSPAAVPAGPAAAGQTAMTETLPDLVGPSASGATVNAATGAPSFDVVRVEPTGEAVIAGRGSPGADIALMDGDKVLAHVQADATGQFALIPPALAEGSHYLTLQVRKPGSAAVASLQSVAVTIAKAGTARPLVALLSPDKPTQILSDGSPGPASNATTPVAAAKPNATPVAIQTVEAAQGGRFTASGVARAGSQCRVYLNGAYLADVTAGQDGHWSVEVKKGMKPGRYTVRADELEASSGKVVNRAEVPFDYPATVAAGHAKNLLMARGTPDAQAPRRAGAALSTPIPARGSAPAVPTPAPAITAKGGAPATDVASAAGKPDIQSDATATGPAPTAVIAELSTATVIRGDSLWRISRKMLGHGVKYTEIYASNVSQIRDPKLIYPGQVFVVPAKPAN